MILTWLYVPASRPERFDKARHSGADAVIVDLEDALAPDQRPQAREYLQTWRPEAAGADIWVRINHGDDGLRDLDALRQAPAPIAGLVLAKADLSWTRQVRELIAADPLEQPQPPTLSPLIETARGILEAPQIARVDTVDHLQIGEYDLIADLGLDPGSDEAEVAPYRSAVVLASAAAGLRPPPGPVSTAVRDLARLEITTDRARRQGFVGRACIHPVQIPVVRHAFRPTREAVEAAAATLAAAGSSGAVLAAGGTMVDEAVLRSARRVLDLKRALG